MHAVILAAGEGSRMGEHTEDVPKAFMEIDGRTLYERQREALDRYVESTTVVLGYRHENVVDRIAPDRTVVVDRWDEYDNAESLYRALVDIEGQDVLVLNGDVVVTPDAVTRVVRGHEAVTGHSVVAHLPGIQEEHTAIQLDADGRVVDYGEISGYRHAGLGILDEGHLETATSHLRNNRAQWYPSMYEAVPTAGVVVPSESHLEINRPQDKRSAKGRLPLT